MCLPLLSILVAAGLGASLGLAWAHDDNPAQDGVPWDNRTGQGGKERLQLQLDALAKRLDNQWTMEKFEISPPPAGAGGEDVVTQVDLTVEDAKKELGEFLRGRSPTENEVATRRDDRSLWVWWHEKLHRDEHFITVDSEEVDREELVLPSKYHQYPSGRNRVIVRFVIRRGDMAVRSRTKNTTTLIRLVPPPTVSVHQLPVPANS
jgi:hypothetical protein